MTKFRLQACPRCEGAIVDYSHPSVESPMCIVCGWREQRIPQTVADEVSEHLGRPYVEHTYTHSSPFRGKPPLERMGAGKAAQSAGRIGGRRAQATQRKLEVRAGVQLRTDRAGVCAGRCG